jgi:hypothetical protein
MTDETARRGRGRPGTPAAERAGYRPPIKAERMAEVRAYAEATGGSVTDAVDRLLVVGIRAWRSMQLADDAGQRPGRTGRPKKETKP